MKKLICAFFVIAILAACQDIDDYPVPPPSHTTQTHTQSFSITLEDALASLAEFNGSDSETSRNENNLDIDTIIVVRYNDVLSRGKYESGVDDIDSILYVINYADNAGYSILAADKRIPNPVIAVAEEGSLDSESFQNFLGSQTIRPVSDIYPPSGDGFFTTPETGDEVFINPNTVNFCLETDTLIGNYETQDHLANKNGEIVDYNYNSEPNYTYIANLCVNYAVDEVKNHKDWTDRRFLIDDECSDGYVIGGASGTVRPEITTTEVSYSSWVEVERCNPSMSLFKLWNQGDPFNVLYPKKRKFGFFGHKRNAPAGCVPLSIAKIMTKFEYPHTFIPSGVTIDWASLKSHSYPISNNAKKSASHLLYGISEGCNSWYFYQGTFTFPKKASAFMSFVGFENVKRLNYNFDRVRMMLDASKPIIIYSIPGINVFDSHCWLIDGYKIKSRIKTVKTYTSNTLLKTENITQYNNMVHCDFGWGGKANGYYVSGLFKLNSPEVEFDPGSDTDKKTNYNHHVRVIMYDLP